MITNSCQKFFSRVAIKFIDNFKRKNCEQKSPVLLKGGGKYSYNVNFYSHPLPVSCPQFFKKNRCEQAII